MVSSASDLLMHKGLHAALWLYSWMKRVCNMNTERLLSLIRKSAPQRCVVERLLSAGFLTQVHSKHLQASGCDVRKVDSYQKAAMVLEKYDFAKCRNSICKVEIPTRYNLVIITTV